MKWKNAMKYLGKYKIGLMSQWQQSLENHIFCFTKKFLWRQTKLNWGRNVAAMQKKTKAIIGNLALVFLVLFLFVNRKNDSWLGLCYLCGHNTFK